MATQNGGAVVVLKRFSHVVAKEKNGGIGYKNKIPWPRIPTDLKFMETICSDTKDKNKQNAVILGRLTWESIPKKYRPLSNRFNVVLTSRPSSEITGAHLVTSTLQDAMERLSVPPLSDTIEEVYIMGGTRVYKEALASPLSDKIYMTQILQEFESDTFWPEYDESKYKLVDDDTGLVPQGLIEENDKTNAIIMGRVIWETLSVPFSNRFNVVLTSRPSSEITGAHLVTSILQDAMERLSVPPLSDTIEGVYIMGGSRVYKEPLASPLSDKIYMTQILQELESDTFWPEYDESKYKLIDDDTGLVSQGLIEENGVKYRFNRLIVCIDNGCND